MDNLTETNLPGNYKESRNFNQCPNPTIMYFNVQELQTAKQQLDAGPSNYNIHFN